MLTLHIYLYEAYFISNASKYKFNAIILKIHFHAARSKYMHDTKNLT